MAVSSMVPLAYPCRRAQFREVRSRKQRLAEESMATGTGQRRRLSTSERRKRTEFFARGSRRLRRMGKELSKLSAKTFEDAALESGKA